MFDGLGCQAFLGGTGNLKKEPQNLSSMLRHKGRKNVTVGFTHA
jgi:hypothetical protein